MRKFQPGTRPIISATFLSVLGIIIFILPSAFETISEEDVSHFMILGIFSFLLGIILLSITLIVIVVKKYKRKISLDICHKEKNEKYS